MDSLKKEGSGWEQEGKFQKKQQPQTNHKTKQGEAKWWMSQKVRDVGSVNRQKGLWKVSEQEPLFPKWWAGRCGLERGRKRGEVGKGRGGAERTIVPLGVLSSKPWVSEEETGFKRSDF